MQDLKIIEHLSLILCIQRRCRLDINFVLSAPQSVKCTSPWILHLQNYWLKFGLIPNAGIVQHQHLLQKDIESHFLGAFIRNYCLKFGLIPNAALSYTNTCCRKIRSFLGAFTFSYANSTRANCCRVSHHMVSIMGHGFNHGSCQTFWA